MNVYHVQMVEPVPISPQGSHFSGKATNYVYVTASSFEAALVAARKKYPQSEVRSIGMVNYNGVPIVAGE